MEIVYTITESEQLVLMLEYLKSNPRDYVLFNIGVGLGIKMNDLANQQVSFYRQACADGFIKIRHKGATKYKNDIYLYLSDELNKLISDYIKDRADSDWMFPSRKGGTPITRQHINRLLKKAANEAGIHDSVGYPSMRKTFGYWYYMRTRDLKMLMQIFNHTSEDVTLKYIGLSDS